jgi:hypothetical protein
VVALIVSALMTVSILLAGPLPSVGAPSAQPLPQPSAIRGLDR